MTAIEHPSHHALEQPSCAIGVDVVDGTRFSSEAIARVFERTVCSNSELEPFEQLGLTSGQARCIGVATKEAWIKAAAGRPEGFRWLDVRLVNVQVGVSTDPTIATLLLDLLPLLDTTRTFTGSIRNVRTPGLFQSSVLCDGTVIAIVRVGAHEPETETVIRAIVAPCAGVFSRGLVNMHDIVFPGQGVGTVAGVEVIAHPGCLGRVHRWSAIDGERLKAGQPVLYVETRRSELLAAVDPYKTNNEVHS